MFVTLVVITFVKHEKMRWDVGDRREHWKDFNFATQIISKPNPSLQLLLNFALHSLNTVIVIVINIVIVIDIVIVIALPSDAEWSTDGHNKLIEIL